jgi:hypothetical protein
LSFRIVFVQFSIDFKYFLSKGLSKSGTPVVPLFERALLRMYLKSIENRQNHVVHKHNTGGLFFSTFQKVPLFEICEKDGEILLMKRGCILAYTFLLANRLFLPLLPVFDVFGHF